MKLTQQDLNAAIRNPHNELCIVSYSPKNKSSAVLHLVQSFCCETLRPDSLSANLLGLAAPMKTHWFAVLALEYVHPERH